MFEVNSIIHGDCLEVMRGFPDDCIDMTCTSPPYDNLREYQGYEFDFESIARQLFRVTKPGGVVVWVVGDATVNGSETGTSFRQALYFMDCGFKLHDTMIFDRDSFQKPNHNRYWACFEYMFVFSKLSPATSNMICDRRNSQAGKTVSSKTIRNADGTTSNRKPVKIANFGKRKNIWAYSTGYGKGTTGKIAYKHPATFPEQLANDHIISWSNPGDLILDCFSGSGTTCKMAVENHRKYIGIEISEEYCKIAETRIKNAEPSLF